MSGVIILLGMHALAVQCPSSLTALTGSGSILAFMIRVALRTEKARRAAPHVLMA
jgi:hypothetical protein